MQFGPHSLGLPNKGRLELRDGVIYVYRDDSSNNPQPYARIFVGPDGLTVDGAEVTLAQRDDPAAIRFLSRGKGAKLKGKISFNELRDDGRGEEVAYFAGGLADDAKDGELRGEMVGNIRVNQEERTETVFVATTAYNNGRPWTGMRNFAGWLWKFAFGGDDRPGTLELSDQPPALLRAPGGETECHMQGDGNLVVYDVRPGITPPPGEEGPWVALSTQQGGKIRDFRKDGRYDITTFNHGHAA